MREKELVLGEIESAFGMVPNFFKYQADVDPEWCDISWQRFTKIMLEGELDRKTKEIIAVVVSLVKDCNYCVEAHKNSLRMMGTSEKEIVEIFKVVELFESFNSIANSLNIPCDVMP